MKPELKQKWGCRPQNIERVTQNYDASLELHSLDHPGSVFVLVGPAFRGLIILRQIYVSSVDFDEILQTQD